jgi:hypothetical protein
VSHVRCVIDGTVRRCVLDDDGIIPIARRHDHGRPPAESTDSGDETDSTEGDRVYAKNVGVDFD